MDINNTDLFHVRSLFEFGFPMFYLFQETLSVIVRGSIGSILRLYGRVA